MLFRRQKEAEYGYDMVNCIYIYIYLDTVCPTGDVLRLINTFPLWKGNGDEAVGESATIEVRNGMI